MYDKLKIDIFRNDYQLYMWNIITLLLSSSLSSRFIPMKRCNSRENWIFWSYVKINPLLHCWGEFNTRLKLRLANCWQSTQFMQEFFVAGVWKCLFVFFLDFTIHFICQFHVSVWFILKTGFSQNWRMFKSLLPIFWMCPYWIFRIDLSRTRNKKKTINQNQVRFIPFYYIFHLIYYKIVAVTHPYLITQPNGVRGPFVLCFGYKIYMRLTM